jgi:transposase
MVWMTDRIILSPPERRELKRLSRSRSARTEDARRANILLSLASGAYSLREISRAEQCSVNTVCLWRDRFLAQRLPGLFSRHRGRQTQPGSEKIEARILDWKLHRKPADSSTDWSSRKLVG